MSAPQIIRTPGGEELVVLPRAEYEALLERADREAEDADDVAIYDTRKAELAAGGVVLPPEVSAAILRGESRLKAIRNWRGETQQDLNFKTGIGQGYLSDLESGRRMGTPRPSRSSRRLLMCRWIGFLRLICNDGGPVRHSLRPPPSTPSFYPGKVVTHHV